MSGSIVAFPSVHTITRPAGRFTLDHLRAFAGHLAQEWRVRRAMSELQSVDARGLRDIGLTRSSIEGAIRHGLRDFGGVAGVADVASDMSEAPRMPPSWTEWR
jgi:uncharacterized protein YjiS (DUF1127 family)